MQRKVNDWAAGTVFWQWKWAIFRIWEVFQTEILGTVGIGYLRADFHSRFRAKLDPLQDSGNDDGRANVRHINFTKM